jgi:tRNA(fMet)-specific endonuclease VapC
MKILDTDHCIAILRGKLDLHGRILTSEPLAVTAITIGELTHGAYKSVHTLRNAARMNALLASLIALPFDAQAAQYFGQLKASLERAGLRLADLDLQIASIALQHNLLLVTHNRRHFAHIPQLQLEDWLS